MRHLMDCLAVWMGWHRPPAALHRYTSPPRPPELHHEWLPPTPPPVRLYRLAEVARDYGYGRVSRWELDTWASVMAWRDRLNDRLNQLAWQPARIAYRDAAGGQLRWHPATPAVMLP